MADWRTIRRLYLRGCGNSPVAMEDSWTNLNYAYREVCAQLQLPELHIPNATVNTVANQDWIELDCDVYSLDWIQDRTNGYKLKPEPGGMRGRARYMEPGQARPPIGEIHSYIRKGSRIWLRDTPDSVRILMLSFRFHPPEIDDSNLAQHPITPPQYDMAIAKMAVSNFFVFNPPAGMDGPDTRRSGQLRSEALADLVEPTAPEKEENLDREQYVRQHGYDFNVR